MVAGWNWALCSATGNCGVWVYGYRKGRLIKLLSDVSFSDSDDFPVSVSKAVTRGYKILRLKTHHSGYETASRKLVFHKLRYVEAECNVEIIGFDGSRSVMSCEKWRAR